MKSKFALAGLQLNIFCSVIAGHTEVQKSRSPAENLGASGSRVPLIPSLQIMRFRVQYSGRNSE